VALEYGISTQDIPEAFDLLADSMSQGIDRVDEVKGSTTTEGPPPARCRWIGTP